MKYVCCYILPAQIESNDNLGSKAEKKYEWTYDDSMSSGKVRTLETDPVNKQR